MKQTRVDDVTHPWQRLPSRRDVLRGIAGTGLGFGILRKMGDAEASNKHKKKRKGKNKAKPLTLNRYGCVDAGQPCRGDSSNCCSGVCNGVAPRKGKPDRSRCASHDAGICTPETNSCQVGVDVPCGPSNVRGVCTATTGKAAFCADISAGAKSYCRVCSKDADCQGEFGVGAACVVFDGPCTYLCPATGRTACIPPAV